VSVGEVNGEWQLLIFEEKITSAYWRNLWYLSGEPEDFNQHECRFLFTHAQNNS